MKNLNSQSLFDSSYICLLYASTSKLSKTFQTDANRKAIFPSSLSSFCLFWVPLFSRTSRGPGGPCSLSTRPAPATSHPQLLMTRDELIQTYQAGLSAILNPHVPLWKRLTLLALLASSSSCSRCSCSSLSSNTTCCIPTI